MTLDEFTEALDTFGADLDDWPADVAAAGRGLLDRSAEARAALSDARALDAGLADLLAQPVRAPAGLARKIMVETGTMPVSADIIPLPTRAAPPAPPMPTRWRPSRTAMIAVAAMVVCFIGGMVSVQTVFDDGQSSESLYVSAIYGDLAW